MNCTAIGRTLAIVFLPSLCAQPSAPTISAIVNAASYAAPPVAPGEMITVFGNSMGPTALVHAQLDPQGRISTALSGVQALFDGNAAPLIYVSATQIAAMVPFGLSGRTTTKVQIVYQGLASTPVSLQVAQAAPGIFSADASGEGQAAMTNADASYNSPTNPAMPGSYVTFYITGAGQTNPAGSDGTIATDAVNLAKPISVQVGGSSAEVLYAGAAPGNVDGFTQVNAVIPANLTQGGNLPLVVQVDGAKSQAGITVAVSGTPAPTTVFLIHGLLQGDPNSSSGVATSPPPTGAPPLGYLKAALEQLDSSEFLLDDGFNWGRCANPPVFSGCPSDCAIQEGARELAAYILAANPPGNIVLVGYSLGGLLARDLLLNNYAKAVASRKTFLVTMGTPNIGYPHLAIDDILICPTLGSQMSSDLRAQQANNMILESEYLLALNGAWTASSFPTMPLQWLAVSGTFCPNPLRSLDPLGNAGCSAADPFNDGVVCDQSARFQVSGKNLPTSTLAASDFAHTKDQLAADIGGSLFEGCVWTTPGKPYALFEPPENSDVLNALITFIKGTRAAR